MGDVAVKAFSVETYIVQSPTHIIVAYSTILCDYFPVWVVAVCTC